MTACAASDASPDPSPSADLLHRFLVVDDNEDIRSLLGLMVERLGHSADLASDGVEAVDALSTARYDVMLLDLTMPRMSGEDVLRWLREHPDRAEGLHVVVVSAWAAENTGDLEALGAHSVMPKPLRAVRLRELVATLGSTPADR